jgi:hypothetical protein
MSWLARSKIGAFGLISLPGWQNRFTPAGHGRLSGAIRSQGENLIVSATSMVSFNLMRCPTSRRARAPAALRIVSIGATIGVAVGITPVVDVVAVIVTAAIAAVIRSAAKVTAAKVTPKAAAARATTKAPAAKATSKAPAAEATTKVAAAKATSKAPAAKATTKGTATQVTAAQQTT